MEKGLLFFIYIYTVQSLKNVRVILFLFILIHLSFVINATNFFIHSLKRFVLGKYCLTGFLQLGALFIPSLCKDTFQVPLNLTEKKTFSISLQNQQLLESTFVMQNFKMTFWVQPTYPPLKTSGVTKSFFVVKQATQVPLERE